MHGHVFSEHIWCNETFLPWYTDDLLVAMLKLPVSILTSSSGPHSWCSMISSVLSCYRWKNKYFIWSLLHHGEVVTELTATSYDLMKYWQQLNSPDSLHKEVRLLFSQDCFEKPTGAVAIHDGWDSNPGWAISMPHNERDESVLAIFYNFISDYPVRSALHTKMSHSTPNLLDSCSDSGRKTKQKVQFKNPPEELPLKATKLYKRRSISDTLRIFFNKRR